MDFLHEGYFLGKIVTAVLNFLPLWLILRRGTPDNGRDVTTSES
jgi:hypothetical protein